ncbi:potassium transporter TrkA [Halogeometricum sp. S1BR25-6]|uniref:Potassium transporter TrkA n=1 Tax=Halogeometricum salsisoli TaxID=2950536 RepID=A0ABU2GFD3_9EURY|nr:potassium transporter TrkA [Halogeometricum sp. S1BR25-6]MDS0299516.1 potassium transporter TrkA [Halogeometricum sp. S1BR25-6]
MTLLLQLDAVIRSAAVLLNDIALIASLAVGAAAVAAAAALVHRWYTREPIPRWLASLFGGTPAAVYISGIGLLDTITDPTRAADVFEPSTMLLNSTVLVAAVAVSPAGRAVGDRVATDVFAFAGTSAVDAEVGRIVRTVGRVAAVELPEDPDNIGDIDGYDPVPRARKEAMAGKRLLFPRRLTDAELTDRLVTRIKEDYGIGHVDVELDEAGDVSFLALGRRVAGLGPTMPPGVAAVAVRADPGAGASAGDAVQLWRTGEDGAPERVVGAELRATAGDVATVILDESDAQRLDRGEEYRLLTLPSDPGAEHEFTSLLRSADETMERVTVELGSDLVGATLGNLDATVVAVRGADEDEAVDAIPARARELAAGDELFIVARPETVRRISRFAAAPEADDGDGGDSAGTPASPASDSADDD